MITLTESAQLQLQHIMTSEGSGTKGIRLGVRGGGCSGFSYVMEFAKDEREGDRILNQERIPVFIDPKSYVYLEGLEIDYKNDILNGGFKFVNPNASKSCGCGTSFAV